jgi:hypothetical protein
LVFNHHDLLFELTGQLDIVEDLGIPGIQHLAAQDWADLWAIPLYEARNL